ncbi:MAG: efflux RND transporter periplasmic adaptor subunit [Bacteroidetes bacterium]|nr:efflux RND transporter periplasmic adaptor subunit [Bacteroidota bacterium]
MTTTRKLLLAAGGILILATAFYILKTKAVKKDTLLKVPVKQGEFQIAVTTTGELQALNSEDIKGPAGLRQAGVWNVKITDLIAEGTVVKEGDYVATLDRSEISNKLKDLNTELSKIESQYTQTRLDTTLELRKLRDELLNLKFGVEEKELILKQSKYEPPATIRQAEIEVEKAKRTWAQEQKNYILKTQQTQAKMQEIAATLSQQKSKYDQMSKLLDEFVINAPKSGMLIYKKNWNGQKLKVGSSIGAWDPTVATLPDLSVMVTQTYVNEVDISKVKMGQAVVIGVDAFPDKKYHGKVTSVANIGEQLPNNDAKVFEVMIQLEEQDTLLRPAMTTSSTIIIQTVKNAVHIPLDALHGSDTLNYVFKDDGGSIIKQEVVVGGAGSDDAWIQVGLKKNEIVYLNTPADADKLKMVFLSPSQKPKKPKRVKVPDKPKKKSDKGSDDMMFYID